MVDPVYVAPGAVKKVWSLLEAEGDLSLRFRAYVTGGGCQGLQYGFALESASEADDCEVCVDVDSCLSPALLQNFLSMLRCQAEFLLFSVCAGKDRFAQLDGVSLGFMGELGRQVEENRGLFSGTAVQGFAKRRFFLLLIDPISLPYLTGSEIDYVVDGQGERFVVKNPQAKTTCGCDRSFTLGD